MAEKIEVAQFAREMFGPRVGALAGRMLARLVEKWTERGISGLQMPDSHLLNLLEMKAQELDDALCEARADHHRLLTLAADVANYALMLADPWRLNHPETADMTSAPPMVEPAARHMEGYLEPPINPEPNA